MLEWKESKNTFIQHSDPCGSIENKKNDFHESFTLTLKPKTLALAQKEQENKLGYPAHKM